MTAAKTRGTKFRDALLDEYDFRTDELLLLDEIAAVIDTIDRTKEVQECRQQRLLLSRLLGQLGVPNDDGKATMNGKTVRGRRANLIRQNRGV
jgi:hypothetical protein